MALHNQPVGVHDPHPSNDTLRHTFQAVVTSIKDPNKSGRVQVQMLGDQAQVKNLPWVVCEVSNEAQLRGMGSFPPNYQVGSKVTCEWNGDSIVLRGSIPNTIKDEKKDMNGQAASSDPLNMIIRALKKKGFSGSTRAAINKAAGFAESSWDWDGPDMAKRINEAVFNQKAYAGDAMQSCMDFGCSPKHLKNIFGQLKFPTLNKPFTMGSFPFDGLNNTAKSALQTLGKNGNLIDKALEMTQSMQSFAERGNPINAMEILGGAQNFTSAIASVASLMSSLSSQMGVKKEKDSLDELLYKIYNEETGLLALDDNGNETKEFKIWREQYMLRSEGAIS